MPPVKWSCPQGTGYVLSNIRGTCVDPNNTSNTMAAIPSCGDDVHWYYDSVANQCTAVGPAPSCPTGYQEVVEISTPTENIPEAACFSGNVDGDLGSCPSGQDPVTDGNVPVGNVTLPLINCKTITPAP